jgi:hypothetical protein
MSVQQSSVQQLPNFLFVSEEWLTQRFQEFNAQITSLKELILANSKGSLDKRFTFEEAMNILDVSDKTLRKYLRDGLIPYSEIGTKKYIRAFDLEEYFNRYYISKKLK